MLASIIAVFEFNNRYQKQSFYFSFKRASLILSNIKTFASTAIPTVKIIPAIPGKVSVASKIVRIPINKNILSIRAILDINPNNRYLYII